MKPNKQKAMSLILSDVVKCVQCIYIVAKALQMMQNYQTGTLGDET